MQLKQFADSLWADINSGAAEADPSLLARWSLTAFSDLKKYRFSYWFAFPAITPPSERSFTLKEPATPAADYFSSSFSALSPLLDSASSSNKMVFLLKVSGAEVAVGELKDWATFWGETPEADRVVCIATPGASCGWPLRNLLVLLKHRFDVGVATILQLRRDRADAQNFTPSDIVKIDLFGQESASGLVGPWRSFTDRFGLPEWTQDQFGVVGWERTENKLAPRSLNLEATMDPSKYAHPISPFPCAHSSPDWRRRRSI